MTTQYARKLRLLSGLSGKVLEIGAGRGVNFGFLGRGVDWIGLEPSRRRRGGLAARAAAAGHSAEILTAPAEAIPLADDCCDVVVSTIVLCSVRDQDMTLAEVLRVLRPGGRFVFLEHVAAADGTWTRRLQRWCAPISRLLDNGCDPGRDTAIAIGRAGFATVEQEDFDRAAGFGLTVPFIAGNAWKPAREKV